MSPKFIGKCFLAKVCIGLAVDLFFGKFYQFNSAGGLMSYYEFGAFLIQTSNRVVRFAFLYEF